MGFFELASASEALLLFDSAPLARKSWQTRNRIKVGDAEHMLNLSVKRDPRGTAIREARLADGFDPYISHWEQIASAYKGSQYFALYAQPLQRVYDLFSARNKGSSGWSNSLWELNKGLITAMMQSLGIPTKIDRTSDLECERKGGLKGTERVAAMCKEAGITVLYDGASAKDFLDVGLMRANGIEVVFQDYKHPKYRQAGRNFIPYLSAVDLLFNEGPRSLEIIRSGGG
jgi:hypothetical protein